MESQNTESKGSEKAKSTFQDRVNEVVSQMKPDKNGNYQMPEGDFPEEVIVAANAERRRRSTESALTKRDVKLKAKEKVIQKLAKQIVGDPTANLSEDEKEELDYLMRNDPAKWRNEMNNLESKATTSLQTAIESYDTEASQQAELEARKDVLVKFNQANPDIELTDDLLQKELPPRMWKALENGAVTFEQFLTSAVKYINTSKKVGSGFIADDDPSLGDVGGGYVPDANAQRKANDTAYENVLY